MSLHSSRILVAPWSLVYPLLLITEGTDCDTKSVITTNTEAVVTIVPDVKNDLLLKIQLAS